MSLFFVIPWTALLYYSSKTKSHFLFFFVLCQFIFVGLGLFLFPYLGYDYMSTVFPTLNLSTINNADFNIASAILLSCTFIVVVFSALMRESSIRKCTKPRGLFRNDVGVRSVVAVFLAIISLIIAVPFLMENYSAFNYVMLASEVGDLGEFVELRRDATTNYFITLFIYNILPALAIISLLQHLQKRRAWTFLFFSFLTILASACLLMTFQKRPLLVFWGSSGLTYFLWRHTSHTGQLADFKFYDLIKQQKTTLLTLFSMLFIFYYYYTGFRFDSEILEIILKIGEIIYTRLIGRLSIPAAMYVDFFPKQHDFYGLSNVGIFSSLLGNELFLDTKVVYSRYADNDGSLAASIFFDAYGQGGFLLSIIYSYLIAIIICLMDYIAYRSFIGAQRVFFVVSGFVLIYYLSQASLFRAAFGYGWFFYLSVWFVCIGPKMINFRKRKADPV